jgi:myo-inositol-1(or 4)-monophosphatase
MSDLHDELLAVALAAAAAAVELIHDRRPASLRISDKSSATDHVTEMDIASEQLIRRTIAARRPHDRVVGEEGQPDAVAPGATTDVVWWVDPIDGTTNYVYDHPGYNVSIAAQIDDRTVAAVVADPTHGRTYRATLGGGAWCDDRRLMLATPAIESPSTLLANALVATGFSYSSERRARQGQVVAGLLPRIRDIRRMGAAALDLCSVASGRVDAYFEVGLAMWDLAAGELIATEAGARVGPIAGGPGLPDSVLAAHPARFDVLQEVLAELGAGAV